MFREMRRKDRALSEEEAYKILETGEYGILSMVDKDGQPYAVPINYIVLEDTIYFHCAKEGQKLDCIRHESRCCFTVVGKTQPVYDKSYTTYFESVVAFGTVASVEDIEVKKDILIRLVEKYLPQHMDQIHTVNRSMPITGVIAFKIQHITGKAKRPSN